MATDRKISVREQEQLLLLLVYYLAYAQDRARSADETPRIHMILGLLRLCYAKRGYPYGDGNENFQRWLHDLWPTPPAA